MKFSQYSILVLVLYSASAVTSFAAEILDPPPSPPFMVLRGPIYEEEDNYIHGDAGLAINRQNPLNAPATIPSLLHESRASISMGANPQHSIGSMSGDGPRFDLTREWYKGNNSQETEHYTGSCASDALCLHAFQGSFWHAVLLANGYIDLADWNGFTS